METFHGIIFILTAFIVFLIGIPASVYFFTLHDKKLKAVFLSYRIMASALFISITGFYLGRIITPAFHIISAIACCIFIICAGVHRSEMIRDMLFHEKQKRYRDDA